MTSEVEGPYDPKDPYNKWYEEGKPTIPGLPAMDHYIRRRPDIIEASFEWLRRQLEVNKPW